MKNLKTIFGVGILLLTFVVTAQEVQVKKMQYNKKLVKEYFGEFGKPQKSQFNKMLYAGNKVDTTKIWLIHYKETLSESLKADRSVDNIDNEIQDKVVRLYFYKNSTSVDTVSPNWYKDEYDIFKRLFAKNDASSFFILMHPNGEYFRSYKDIKPKRENALVKYKKFKKEKDAFDLKLFKFMVNN